MTGQKESLENYLLGVAAALFYNKSPRDSLFELVEPSKVTVSLFADWYASRTRQQKYRVRSALNRLRSKGYVDLSFSTTPPSLELTDAGRREYLRRCIVAGQTTKSTGTTAEHILILMEAEVSHRRDVQTMHLFLDSLQCNKLQLAVWSCPNIILPHLHNAADVLNLSDAITFASVTSVHKLSDTDREY